MKKFFYDEDIDEEEEDLGSEERLNLDNPEEVDNGDGFEQTDDEIGVRLTNRDLIDLTQFPTVLAALRNEMKLLDLDRGVLAFRYKGINYEGIPMVEINPNKFVFNITSDAGDKNVNVSFKLSDITTKNKRKSVN